MGSRVDYPEVYVFAKLAGRELSWEEYETEPEFEGYDPEEYKKYKLIQEGNESSDGARYGDSEVLNYVIIERISDTRFFKMSVHWDSWDSVDYNYTGDYGGVVEVFPVEKVVYVEKL